MLTVDVLNKKGEKVDTVSLSADVFEVKAPRALIHEVVTAYLANERRGTHSTKTRGEVSGGGLKPWKQKHTGNARAGFDPVAPVAPRRNHVRSQTAVLRPGGSSGETPVGLEGRSVVVLSPTANCG